MSDTRTELVPYNPEEGQCGHKMIHLETREEGLGTLEANRFGAKGVPIVRGVKYGCPDCGNTEWEFTLENGECYRVQVA